MFVNSYNPPLFLPFPEKIENIDAGNGFLVILTKNGDIFTYGDNSKG